MKGVKHTDTVLDKIVATKPYHIDALSERYSNLLHTRPEKSERSLYQALKNKPTNFILECKKASPSKGLLREHFDPVAIAQIYNRYAAAISVLTDEQFFQGDFAYLEAVCKTVTVPVLCKDFIIDTRQLRLARHLGADAALLMLSVLNDELYIELATEAKALGLDILTEVSNEQEMQRAIALKAKIIGINNRNLRDLSIDLSTTKRLARLAPKNAILISESGIYTHQQARQLAPFVHAFLVGSSLTEQKDIDLACRQLIFGHIKVCGLTRNQDAKAVAEIGGVYGGLIFAPNSPRNISIEQAKEIMANAILHYVGVFVNQDIEEIASIANELELFAVQLHGNENEAYIDQLRNKLTNALIWKAVKPDGSNKVANADRLLFDSTNKHQFGGTGTRFDWTKVDKNRIDAMLAGGLNPDNFSEALTSQFYGFDLNSGVEDAPGIKNPKKIQFCLTLARQY